MKNEMDTNKVGFEDSTVVKEIEMKKVKQGMMLFWICLICLVIAVVGAVILHGKMGNQNLEGIKEVEVCVVDVTEKEVRINGSVSTSYEVTVEYMGKEYDLVDGGHSPWTYEGHIGTAYMYEDKIYANEEGPSTRTGVGTLYSVFLISTIALFVITPSVGASALQRRKKVLGK